MTAYNYAGGDLINRFDPSGLWGWGSLLVHHSPAGHATDFQWQDVTEGRAATNSADEVARATNAMKGRGLASVTTAASRA